MLHLRYGALVETPGIFCSSSPQPYGSHSILHLTIWQFNSHNCRWSGNVYSAQRMIQLSEERNVCRQRLLCNIPEKMRKQGAKTKTEKRIAKTSNFSFSQHFLPVPRWWKNRLQQASQLKQKEAQVARNIVAVSESLWWLQNVANHLSSFQRLWKGHMTAESAVLYSMTNRFDTAKGEYLMAHATLSADRAQWQVRFASRVLVRCTNMPNKFVWICLNTFTSFYLCPETFQSIMPYQFLSAVCFSQVYWIPQQLTQHEEVWSQVRERERPVEILAHFNSSSISSILLPCLFWHLTLHRSFQAHFERGMQEVAQDAHSAVSELPRRTRLSSAMQCESVCNFYQFVLWCSLCKL